MSIAYLSDLERGRLSNPTLDKLRAIADELDVSVDELLGGATAAEQPPDFARGGGRSPELLALTKAAAFRDAVRDQAARLGEESAALTEQWLDALAGIEIGGRRPQTTSDYMFIFEAARRAVDH